MPRSLMRAVTHGFACLSCYRQLFARGQTFTYDLTDIGEYFLQYRAHDGLLARGIAGQVSDRAVRRRGDGFRQRRCAVCWNSAICPLRRAVRISMRLTARSAPRAPSRCASRCTALQSTAGGAMNKSWAELSRCCSRPWPATAIWNPLIAERPDLQPWMALRMSIDRFMLSTVFMRSKSFRVMVEGDEPVAPARLESHTARGQSPGGRARVVGAEMGVSSAGEYFGYPEHLVVVRRSAAQ